MSIFEAILVGLFCISIVFAMLILLFVIVSIMSRILRAAKKPEESGTKGGNK